jgi:hypothetical protein
LKQLLKISLTFLFFQISFAQQNYFQKIIPFDGKEGDWFGVDISVFKSYLAVGAHLKSETGYLSGCVYLYKLSEDSTWKFLQKLIPNDLNDRDRLSTVKLYGDYAFLGAWTKEFASADRGVVYAFEKMDTNWIQVQKIIPQYLSTGADFGDVIDANQDYLFIGSPTDTSGSKKTGTVFIFKKSGLQWIEHQRLIPLSNKEYQFYGSDISANDSILVVGASSDSNSVGEYAGTVYFYKLKNDIWELFYVLNDKYGQWDGLFGNSLSLNNDCVAIGATGSILTNTSGKVQIYQIKEENVLLLDEIKPSDSMYNNDFGGSVKLINDSLFVGATSSLNNVGISTGAVYFFINMDNTWIEVEKFIPIDAISPQEFGWSVDVNGDFLFISDVWGYQHSIRSGAVYIFSDKVLSIADDIKSDRSYYQVYQNYPNPFNSQTKIVFSINIYSRVLLNIYNSLGEKIYSYHYGELSPGSYVFLFDGSKLSSGIYIYEIILKDNLFRKKMILLK